MIAQNSQHRILWLPGEERMWDEDAGSRSAAGVRIDSNNAHQVAAVFSCLRVIAETVAALPLHVLERTPGGGKRIARELPLYRQLHSQPNGWQTSFEWREQAVFHVGLWGDAFSELKAGQIVPLHPSRMKIERVENGAIRYRYREDKGSEAIYSNDQILQIRGPSDDGLNGMRIVEECKEAIALARACEIHGARFFANGARPGFVLSTDGNLNSEARETLANQWDRRHGGPSNAGKTAVLTGGLKPYQLPQSSNSDAQYLELREYQLREIARLFRVPGHLLGLGTGSPQADIEFVTHTILPWLRRFESACTRDLIADDDRYLVEFDIRGLLRGDAASRASFMRSLWEIGALNTDEIRELENMDPVEGGSVRYRPLNMGTLGAPPSVEDVLAQQQKGSGIDGQAVEGGVAAAEGEAAPVEPAQPEAPQIADVSLNGAQVSSLLEIITQYNAGLLTEMGAKAVIAAAFPGIPVSTINTIIAGTSTTPVVVPDRPSEREAPAPQPESRAEPDTVAEGDFVSWDSSGGRARGRVDHVMDYGTLDVPGTDFKIEASEEDPAALITVYEEVTGGWRATETQVGHKVATLTKIDPLPEPPVEENAYGKPKRKLAKRDCGTGVGGFKPGNKCAGVSGGGGGDAGGGGDSGGGSEGGGGIAGARERQSKEREAWKAEKKQAVKELSKQQAKDTAKLDREYERELDSRIDAAAKQHDRETKQKVREVEKGFEAKVDAVGTDVEQFKKVAKERADAVSAVRDDQDKSWQAKSKAIRETHADEYASKYVGLVFEHHARREELDQQFDAKREEIQAKHDAEREQLLAKKRGG